jgi:hypothetical protein
VCKVVDSELDFEAIFGFAFGTGHDACVGNENVEGLRLGEEFCGTGWHAVQRHEIEEVNSLRGYDVWQCRVSLGKNVGCEVESFSRRIESTSGFDTKAWTASSPS